VFENFLADMGHPPNPDDTLDRIENEGHYEPDNCRWASMLEQSNNRRNNRRVTFRGKTLTVMQWSRITGVNRRTIARRLDKNWPLDRVFSAALWGPRRSP
jgi:hypothetical protein